MTYPLAPQGVFLTVQGEGATTGLPMVFVRLGGCPVGCKECDTDYSVATRKSAADIARWAASYASTATEWVWVTGGEPAVFDLKPLFAELRKAGLRIAVATSGIGDVPQGYSYGGCDFLSVSPHRLDERWKQRRGDQVNLVFGLNDLAPDAAKPYLDDLHSGFSYRYVTPCEGKPQTLDWCFEWVYRYAGWRVGHQSHKCWRVP